jgi:hypothetical protein
VVGICAGGPLYTHDRRAVEELAAAPGERPQRGRRVVGVEGDHVDDDVVALVGESLLERRVVLAVPDDLLRAFGQPVLRLPPVEQRHPVPALFEKLPGDRRRDQAGPAYK